MDFGARQRDSQLARARRRPESVAIERSRSTPKCLNARMRSSQPGLGLFRRMGAFPGWGRAGGEVWRGPNDSADHIQCELEVLTWIRIPSRCTLSFVETRRRRKRQSMPACQWLRSLAPALFLWPSAKRQQIYAMQSLWIHSPPRLQNLILFGFGLACLSRRRTPTKTLARMGTSSVREAAPRLIGRLHENASSERVATCRPAESHHNNWLGGQRASERVATNWLV